MTSYDYRRPQSTATRLIKRFGQTATLTRTLPTDKGTTGNPWDPTSDTSQPKTESYPVRVVVTDYSLRELAGGVVAAGQRKVLMSVEGLPAQIALGTDWHLKIGATVYSVCAPVTTYDPGGTVLCYEFPVQA